MTLARSVVAVMALAVTAGCATFRGSDAPPSDWQTMARQLQAVADWELDGRVASRGAESFVGNLHWRQTGKQFEIRISGPLGIGGYQASGSADEVLIEQGDKRWYSDNPDAFLRDMLGWEFPFDGLRFWALGLPVPGHARELHFDESGRLIGIQQFGWSIVLENHRQFGRYLLPRRLTLTEGETRVRIVVDDWQALRG